MALPAGCSSDEGWGSYDDEITFANNFCEIKKVVPELDKKSILTQEQKLIDAIREEKFNEVQELLENGELKI